MTYKCPKCNEELKRALIESRGYYCKYCNKYFSKITIEHPEIDLNQLEDAAVNWAELRDLKEKVAALESLFKNEHGSILKISIPNMRDRITNINKEDLESTLVLNRDDAEALDNLGQEVADLKALPDTIYAYIDSFRDNELKKLEGVVVELLKFMYEIHEIQGKDNPFVTSYKIGKLLSRLAPTSTESTVPKPADATPKYLQLKLQKQLDVVNLIKLLSEFVGYDDPKRRRDDLIKHFWNSNITGTPSEYADLFIDFCNFNNLKLGLNTKGLSVKWLDLAEILLKADGSWDKRPELYNKYPKEKEAPQGSVRTCANCKHFNTVHYPNRCFYIDNICDEFDEWEAKDSDCTNHDKETETCNIGLDFHCNGLEPDCHEPKPETAEAKPWNCYRESTLCGNEGIRHDIIENGNHEIVLTFYTEGLPIEGKEAKPEPRKTCQKDIKCSECEKFDNQNGVYEGHSSCRLGYSWHQHSELMRKKEKEPEPSCFRCENYLMDEHICKFAPTDKCENFSEFKAREKEPSELPTPAEFYRDNTTERDSAWIEYNKIFTYLHNEAVLKSEVFTDLKTLIKTPAYLGPDGYHVVSFKKVKKIIEKYDTKEVEKK